MALDRSILVELVVIQFSVVLHGLETNTMAWSVCLDERNYHLWGKFSQLYWYMMYKLRLQTWQNNPCCKKRNNLNLVSTSNLEIIFCNTHHINSFFPYKHRLNRSLKSKVVYKASCWDCDDFYKSKTKRRLHDRKTEHFKALTESCQASAIADHITSTV